MSAPTRAAPAAVMYTKAATNRFRCKKTPPSLPSSDAWRWSSIYRWKHGTGREKSLLSAWPLPRKPGWLDHVNSVQTDDELAAIQRGSPFGDPENQKTVPDTFFSSVPDTFFSSFFLFLFFLQSRLPLRERHKFANLDCELLALLEISAKN